VSLALDQAPFLTGTARLEDVGKGQRIYVADLDIPGPGKYFLLAEPVGGTKIQGVGNVVVEDKTKTPAVGDRAFPSKTPTLADAPAAELTTRTPPDTELLRVSVADALARKEPFAVVFATPKFCESRTCGPVVDVVDAVRRRVPGVEFIHVEIYEENNPALGVNRWVREWQLPTEPWVFLVGRDGRIRTSRAAITPPTSVPRLFAITSEIVGNREGMSPWTDSIRPLISAPISTTCHSRSRDQANGSRKPAGTKRATFARNSNTTALW
jgi:hypothetical protein